MGILGKRLLLFLWGFVKLSPRGINSSLTARVLPILEFSWICSGNWWERRIHDKIITVYCPTTAYKNESRKEIEYYLVRGTMLHFISLETNCCRGDFQFEEDHISGRSGGESGVGWNQRRCSCSVDPLQYPSLVQWMISGIWAVPLAGFFDDFMEGCCCLDYSIEWRVNDIDFQKMIFELGRASEPPTPINVNLIDYSGDIIGFINEMKIEFYVGPRRTQTGYMGCHKKQSILYLLLYIVV